MRTMGNRPPRNASVTRKPTNRVQSAAAERAQLRAATGALRVEAASQADATADAISGAVPSDLATRLENYETRLQQLESV